MRDDRMEREGFDDRGPMHPLRLTHRPTAIDSRGRLSRWAVSAVAAGLAAVAWTSRAVSQCMPPTSSNEARLMAHYEAPIVFATAAVPRVPDLADVSVTGEVVGVPTPSASISHTSFCYVSDQKGSHLSPVLPRLRLAVGLPAGFALEGSYLPPVEIDRASPNLGSLALTYARQLIGSPRESGLPSLVVAGRVHGTIGRVVGPITCPSSQLQQTQLGQPCYGTKESSDTFYPTSAGVESTLAASHRWLGVFAGTGYTRLTPHFRVGFTNLTGYTDRTLVEVSLDRAVVLGGVTLRVVRALDVSAEAYSVPADLTTWRVAARYRLW